VLPIKNQYFAWAHYHSGLFVKAKGSIPSDMSNALKLKILYQVAKHSDASLSSLFRVEKDSFNSNIGRLNYIIIFMYIRHKYANGDEFNELWRLTSSKGSKVKKRFVIDCIYYFYKRFPVTGLKTSYYTDYEALKALANCLSSQELKKYNPLKDSVFLNDNPIFALLSECRGDASLTSKLLAYVPESRQMRFILEYDYLLSRREVFKILGCEGELQKNFFHKNNRKAIKLLDYTISVGDKDAYTSFYKKTKPKNVKYYIWFLFFNDEYAKIAKIIKTLSMLRLDKAYGQCLYIVYLSLVSIRAKLAIDFVNTRKKRGLNISSYQVLNSLYEGDLAKAELSRAELGSSLESYLNLQYQRVSSINLEKMDKVLFVAEQGVADEIRWARLYSRIDSPNVSITCDYRFYDLFVRSFPNITFIPLHRLFRKPRHLSVEEFHSHNLPNNVEQEEYDCISSTSMLFLSLSDANIKTKNEAYLKVENFGFRPGKKKVGILWSSSFATGLRGHRYGIDKEHYLELIKENSQLEFYCLQSPISDEDRLFCLKNGIYVVDAVDLYNDFNKSSEFLASLDCVVGPSSLNTELAAACGTTFFHIANAAEVAFMRNGELGKLSKHDQLSENTITVHPFSGYGERGSYEITKDCFEHLRELIGGI